MKPICSRDKGLIVSQGFYVPPDKSYLVAPPAGWAVVPDGKGSVEFRARLADQGYWPSMFIEKEPAMGSQLEGVEEINVLVAKDRQNFRFVSGEWQDFPVGRAYLVIYEHTFHGLRMKTAEAHFVCGGVRYWVPFNVLATTFDRHFPTYLNCLKTFAPLEPLSTHVWN